MKAIFYLTLSFFLIKPAISYCQDKDTGKVIVDSVKHTSGSTTSADLRDDISDDFSPGLAFFALFAIGFVLICVGVGIVFTILSLLILFGLISLGILSVSVLIGINKKSFEKGFKTFLVSFSTIGGLVFFSIGFWLLNKIMHWWVTKTAIIIGMSLGLVIGLTFGLLSFYILQRLTTFFKRQLNLA
jgi:hypothetical protein